MSFIFPIHFRVRMIERGIEFDHVRGAVYSPDYKERLADRRILVRKRIEEKTIEVVYCSKDLLRSRSNQYIVITAYYL